MTNEVRLRDVEPSDLPIFYEQQRATPSTPCHLTMTPRFVVLAVTFALASPLPAQTATPSDTAAVRSAQSVFREVESALTQRQLTRQDTAVTCPPSGREGRGSIYADVLHRVRRLDLDGGGEDHSETIATYFDTLGRARFVFAQRGAVNGTQQEERVYYDERGRVIHRLLRQTHGPGYPFDTLSTVPRLETWLRDLCG
jgi:hypothetical protein